MKTTAFYIAGIFISTLPVVHSVATSVGWIEGAILPVIEDFRLERIERNERGNIEGDLFSIKRRSCAPISVTYHVSKRAADNGRAQKMPVAIRFLGDRPKHVIDNPVGPVSHGRIEIETAKIDYPARYLWIYTTHDCSGLWTISRLSEPIKIFLPEEETPS